MKEKILISRCLLGEPCRYDGKSKPVSHIEKLSEKYELIPVCPEVEGGLPTPRLPCEVKNGLVIRRDGKDLTSPYEKGAKISLDLCRKHDIKIALLKEKSPSCGKSFIYDGTFTGTLKEGQGVTAKLLSQNNIKIYSEEDFDQLIKK